MILDLFSSGVGDEFGPGLFARVVQTPWDTWWLVGHCNASVTTVAKAIDTLGLPPLPAPSVLVPADEDPATLYCFDVHNQHFLGELVGSSITMTTKPLDASLLRVWRARPYPFVGGCDRHFSEGGFAVKNAAWQTASNG